MKKNLMMILVVWFSVILNACGFAGVHGDIRDRSNDYLTAKTAEPLKVPAPFKIHSTNEQYVVPSAPPIETPVSIVPVGILD